MACRCGAGLRRETPRAYGRQPAARQRAGHRPAKRDPISSGVSSPAPISTETRRGYSAPMHDAAYKNLFSHPRMVKDLLRGFAAKGWSDRLDFSTLQKLPAEFVSEDLRRR